MPNVLANAMKVLGVCLLAGSSWLVAATNSLTITEKAGATTTNYPVQIGRPFVAGEITNFPQAVVSGTAVPTQADVKQRWSDGSVKHAVVAFLIPRLNAGSTVTVTFQNQTSGNNGGLSSAQMQDPAYDFNAQMLLSNGSTALTADARRMLTAGAYTLWTSGGIAQTVILADHSATRAYDVGFDANRSIRPIFQATFWPGINKVRVRFIGEIANTEALQDQTYSLVLKTGNASPSQVYSKGTFTQSAATRWTKEFWIGGAPPAIAINHNLSYIRETKFVPYYDSGITVPEGEMSNQYSLWTSAGKDIGDNGNWTKSQATGGAREEIGLFAGWPVRWLFSGDSRMKEQAFGNADLGAAFPIHFREGKLGKASIGRVVSIVDRPSLDISHMSSGGSAADNITPVGSASDGGWQPDPAHHGDAWSIIYALSGDPWYMEEMYFWAGWGVAYGGANVWGRGPTGSEGVIEHTQMRELAWILRTRIHAAFFAPDGSAEKSYFEAKVNDALAAEEGMHNITNGVFNGTAIWTFGRNVLTGNWWKITNGAPPALHQYWVGDNSYVNCSQQSQYGINCSTVSAGSSQFEQHYILLVLGRAKELGYPSGALLTWLGQFYTGAITDPGYNPYLLNNGRVGTLKTDGTQFTTYAALKTGYTTDAGGTDWPNKNSFDMSAEGYASWAAAGMSYLTGETNGQTAWNFMNTNFFSPARNGLGGNPKWAILPRGTSNSTPPPPTTISRCDLNNDGVVDAADVQFEISSALGGTACGTADLDSNGRCDVVDVQRVINASQGQSCRVGP